MQLGKVPESSGADAYGINIFFGQKSEALKHSI